jgi:myo-inositol-1-phosphate synthase
MKRIRIAIVGVGNCASSLIQGINHYRTITRSDAIGLMHWEIGGYRPWEIEVAAAFDIDKRKVGRDVAKAIFEKPNCTTVFCRDIKSSGIRVMMGRVLDGCSEHMADYDEACAFAVAQEPQPDMAAVVTALKEARTEIVLNYLPVGSELATRFYAECALEAGAGFINNMPVFIASDPAWAKRFEERKLPLMGDDIKSQLGATIIHRMLVDLCKKRGVRLERTYQINTGGNTDFLNMLNRKRLVSKKTSKTEAVQSVAAERFYDENIHVGPSDYVPWQKDNKVCFIRIEGKLFGGVPMNLELRLSVEDSPNSAGIVIDAIRCCKLALDRETGGVLYSPSAYFMKHPPVQYTDDEAFRMTETFIHGWHKEAEKSTGPSNFLRNAISRLRDNGLHRQSSG